MPARFPVLTTFIFRPGATSGTRKDGVPVYTDFGLLDADLSAVSGRKRIIFDDSLSSPCTIPAGTYNMDDVEWVGAGSTTLANSFRVRVEFAGSVTITNLNHIQGLYLHLPATIGSPIAYNSGGTEFLRVVDCTVNVASTTPMMVVSGTTTLLIQATEESTLGGNNEEWLGLVNVDTVTFNLKERSRVLDDSITSGVNGVIGSITLDATGSFNTSQPQFQGTGGIPTPTLDADAVNVGFTPSVSSNWATVPTGVDEALDGIAGETGFPQTNVVYVSKVGNDSNSGLTPGRAKLTVGSAITAASGLSPGTNNRVTIHVLDAADYIEGALTLPSWVSLLAPSASIKPSGTLALGFKSRVDVHRIVCTGSGVTAVQSTTAQGGYIKADLIQSTGGGVGISVTDGTVEIDVGLINVGAGIGIFANGGVGLYLLGRVKSIFSTNVCVNVASTPNVQLSLDRIEGSGTGLRAASSGSVIDARVGVNLCTTAYDAVNAGATINTVAVRVTGATAGLGTVNEVKAI